MCQPENKNSFIEMFVHKFAPRNIGEGAKPVIRHGMFAEVPFTVTETRNTYSVEMEGRKKSFSNAWEAARWIQEFKG